MNKAGFYALRCRGKLLSKNTVSTASLSAVLRELSLHEEYLFYTKKEAGKLRTQWKKTLPPDCKVVLIHVLLEATTFKAW